MFGQLLSQYSPDVSVEKDRTIVWFEGGYISLNHERSRYFYVREVPPIRNIVMSGGGTRGILYAGVIKAFEEFHGSTCQPHENFISQVRTLSAASIGSVFLAALAVGIHADELHNCLGDINFEKLLGTGFGPIRRSGKPLYQLLKKVIADVILTRLSERKAAYLNFIENTKEEDKEILLKLNEELNSPQASITFAMLNVLHHFCPIIFKNLIISVVCKETGKPCYFSVDNSPHLEIALACRASFAVPIFVTAVPIAKSMIKCYRDNYHLPQTLHFVDGGLLDNIPYSVFEKEEQDIALYGDYKQNLQTLIIFFDDSIAVNSHDIEKEANKIKIAFKHYRQSPFLNARSLTGNDELAPPTFLDSIYDLAPKMIDGINMTDNYNLKRKEMLEEIRYKYSQRNIPLPGWFTSSDFERAHKYAKWAIERSKKITLNYLKNHENECIYQSHHYFHVFLRRLPQDLFELLILRFNEIKEFNHLDKNAIIKIRNETNNHIHGFDDFYPKLLSLRHFAKTNIFELIIQNISLIDKDSYAEANEKELRILAVLLDYYEILRKHNESSLILLFLNKMLSAYFPQKVASFTLLAQTFLNTHPFYVKFQRIIFVLSLVNSHFINPEDIYRRKYIDTIKNDLSDIASFHLNEKKKLEKMENYIFENYCKIIFYQKNENSQLALTLKKIIMRKIFLDLHFKYGILPSPFFCKLSQLKENFLHKYYLHKRKLFIYQFCYGLKQGWYDNGAFLTLAKMKEKFFPLFKLNNLTYLDEIKMQAIVLSFLTSVSQAEKRQVEYLYNLIVPQDLAIHQKKFPTIFAAINLFTLKPFKWERALYHQLTEDLYCIITDYREEGEARNRLLSYLSQYEAKFTLAACQPQTYLFKKSSNILPKIRDQLQQFTLPSSRLLDKKARLKKS